MEKLKEFDAKIQELKGQIAAIKELQNGVRDAVKEGMGVDIEELPEYKKAQELVEFLSEPAPAPPSKKTNESRERSRNQIQLIEKQLNRQIAIINEDFSKLRKLEKQEILREAFLLNEGIISIGTVVSAYGGIVTLFGIAQIGLKGCAMFSKAMGYPDGHVEFYQKRAEAVHHAEQEFIKKTILRPKVLYLIYKSYAEYQKKTKGLEDEKNKKGFSVEKAEAAESFELFMKNKDAQEKATKIGFVAVFGFLFIKAMFQLGNALSKVFVGAGDVISAVKPGVSSGIEGSGLGHAVSAAKGAGHGAAAAGAGAARVTKSIM